MIRPRDQEWRETVWRRPLTPAEMTALTRGQPAPDADAADWQAEAQLTRALARLPDIPVPTNFTARVLAAVEREDARPQGAAAWVSRWVTARGWRWLAPATAAALLLGVGWLAWQSHQAALCADLARDIVTMSRVTELAPPEVFGDFEIINRLGGPPLPDEELLAVMQ